MMNRARRQNAFTLIEIMISVLLVGLLAAIALPSFIRSRTTAQTNVCINNLRNIDHAIHQWALEYKKAPSIPVHFSDISSYLRNSVICPAGGLNFADSYTISIVGVEPTCQRHPATHVISLSSTADDASPSSAPPSEASSPGKSGHGNGKGNGNGPGHSGNSP
jgi:prepilin-type N-terminal cleavage/methylation domain-containing protein